MREGKIPISPERLEKKYDDQIQYMLRSVEAYDEQEHWGEANRLALSIRVLFHDSRTSHSLLKQLNRFPDKIWSSSIERDPKNKIAHGGIITMAMYKNGSRYIAPLDMFPFGKMISFEEWWNEEVFADKSGTPFTRKNLILTAANQDGGGHVDPGLNEFYYKLSEEHSMNWTHHHANGRDTPVTGAEHAAVRQVAHEVLKTLIPGYEKKPNEKDALVFMAGAGVREATPEVAERAKQKQEAKRKTESFPKVGRNDPCPCGSGKKYKYCHGR